MNNSPNENKIFNVLHLKRHPVEWFFLILSGIVTIGVMLFFLIITFSPEFENSVRQEVLSWYDTKVEKTYTENTTKSMLEKSETDTLTEQQLIELSEGQKLISQARPHFVNAAVSFLVSPWPLVVIVVGFVLLILWGTGGEYGKLLAHGVKLSPAQYPEIFNIVSGVVEKFELKKVPDVFTINGDGLLNAYAVTMPGVRNFVAVYSDILERCIRDKDWRTLEFIVGHEVGHIKLGHTTWWYRFLSLPLMLTSMIPWIGKFFANAQTRAMEYSCDFAGAAVSGDSDGRALMMLVAGKYLYQGINMEEYIKNQVKPSLWVFLNNLGISHPATNWRIAALRQNKFGGVFLFRSTEGTLNKLLYLTPRLLSLAYAFFLVSMSIDIDIVPQQNVAELLIGFIVPIIIILGVLYASWKFDIVGGIIFILFGVFFAAWILINTPTGGNVLGLWLTFAGPATIIGVLFLINWRKNKFGRIFFLKRKLVA
jgi:Zn-dependent protease with chaperone function